MGFKIQVNGEQVWESEGEHTAVSTVALSTPRGEAGSVSVANEFDTVNIIVNVRDTEDSLYLDQVEEERSRDRRERLEGRSALLPEGTNESEAPSDPALLQRQEDNEEQDTEDTSGETAGNETADLSL